MTETVHHFWDQFPQSTREGKVTYQGREYSYKVASADAPEHPSGNEFLIHLLDPSDVEQMKDDLVKQISDREWRNDPELQNLEYEYLLVNLETEGVHHQIEIFNYGRRLTEEEKKTLLKTLKLVYGRLGDKSLFTLKEIIIRPTNQFNDKNGEFLRGREFAERRNFELFPASLSADKYRNTLNCSELEGTIVHELTHVILEHLLKAIWEKHQSELGWETIDEQYWIILPGGMKTTLFNSQFGFLPTPYAAYQENDDRAESVVGYLLDPSSLRSEKRVELLNEIFVSQSSPVTGEITQPDHELEQVQLEVYLKPLIGAFKSGSRRQGVVKQDISLKDYREKVFIERRRKRIQSEGELVRELTDKAGKKYVLYKKQNPESNPNFWVYFTLYDDQKFEEVGQLQIWEAHFKDDEAPDKFLAIPHDLMNLPFYQTSIEVMTKLQGQGFGKMFAEMMTAWFQDQEKPLVHVEYFTQSGEMSFFNAFIAAGYQQVAVTNVDIQRIHTTPHGSAEKTWVYKVYGKKDDENSKN